MRHCIAGILVAAIGGGVGVVSMLAGGIMWARAHKDQSHCDGLGCLGPDIEELYGQVICITGAATSLITLAIGIPLAIAGNNQMKYIRESKRSRFFPTIQVSATPENMYMQADWRF